MLIPPPPPNLGLEARYATIIGNMGNLYREMGRFAEAEQAMQEALLFSQQVQGACIKVKGFDAR